MKLPSLFVKLIAVALIAASASPGTALAHQPGLSDAAKYRLDDDFIAERSVGIADPTRASQALYGGLSEPDEVDVYSFVAGADQELPVEALVPVRPSLAEFRPWVAVWGTAMTAPAVPQALLSTIAPLTLPGEYRVMVAGGVDAASPREVFFEPFSVENLYRGREITVNVRAGETYYVAVYDPEHRFGAYSLGVGSAEDFSDANFASLIGRVAKIKLGLHAGVPVPWLDILGTFLMMAGFVIGLGAVTVIDIHGFLGRRSPYWTEATTRTHKVTKPMIWAGLSLAIAGGFLLYRRVGFTGTAPIHALLAFVLVVNGLFLTFRVSPYMVQRDKEGKQAELLPAAWQRKIAASLVFSVIGWWGSLFLFAWHLVMLR